MISLRLEVIHFKIKEHALQVVITLSCINKSALIYRRVVTFVSFLGFFFVSAMWFMEDLCYSTRLVIQLRLSVSSCRARCLSALVCNLLITKTKCISCSPILQWDELFVYCEIMKEFVHCTDYTRNLWEEMGRLPGDSAYETDWLQTCV